MGHVAGSHTQSYCHLGRDVWSVVDRFCNAFGVFMYLYNNNILKITNKKGQKSPKKRIIFVSVQK